ncbi:MAG: PQQ-dependent sugar dehydrogenase [Chryseolinea sp.]
MTKVISLASCIILIWLSGCSNNRSRDVKISIDSLTVASGKLLFTKDCSACHAFDADAIGPSLGGITKKVPADWVMKFIADPQSVIKSGDVRASKLYARFKSTMPSFKHYSQDDLMAIVAYLNTKEGVVKEIEAFDSLALKNPIPERIPESSLIAELKLVTQIPFSSEESPRTRLVKLESHPTTGHLLLLDLRGKIYRVDNGRAETYFDMAIARPAFIHKPGLATGFGSFAFHPEFTQNGLLYTTHTEPPNRKKADFFYNDSIPVTLQWVVTEWKINAPGNFPFEGKGRELLRINMLSGIHGMQEASFNPTATPGSADYRLLYIGIGDGGSVEKKFPFLVHNQKDLWGTIIRIDPAGKNSKNGQYGIPQTNPFAVDGQPSKSEIYAYGFRNPHRLTWLRSGTMLASNIGHSNIESFSIIQSGNDYGWPIREGNFLHLEYGNMTRVYALPADDSIFHMTYPVIAYDHDEGKAISSGYEYTGKNIPALKGKFLFADIVNGRLFYAITNDLRQGHHAPLKHWRISVDGNEVSMEKLCGNSRVDLRLGRDHEGEVYLFTKPDGKVYKIVSAKE